MENTHPPRDIVKLNQALQYMCENIYPDESSIVLNKFKPGSEAIAVAALSLLKRWNVLDDRNITRIAGKELYNMSKDAADLTTALKSMRIEPKLAYIALCYSNREPRDKMKRHVGTMFEFKVIDAHLEELYISDFLPKNSMPVEKEMGLDKPGSLQRIIALEKIVKELKAQVESTKLPDINTEDSRGGRLISSWLWELPQPFKSEAIYQFDDQSIEDRVVYSVDEALNSFRWDGTIQRDGYWKEVRDHIVHGSKAPLPYYTER